MLRYIFFYIAILYALLFASVNADCELESLRQLNEVLPDYKPNAIIDVGANVGCWTSRARTVFPDTKFMMYEAFQNFSVPLERVKSAQNGMVDYEIGVMSAKDGEEVKFWAEGTTGNSMFPQLMGRGGRGHSDIEPVIRTTKRLDTARSESFLKDERVDVLKLDVQGAELTVLKGATELLKEVSFVQFEASVVEYNKGGSCFYEVDNYLRQHGFFFYDFGDVMRNPGLFQSPGAGQFDALYIRPTSETLPTKLRALKPNLFCGSDRDQRITGTPDESINRLSAVEFTGDNATVSVPQNHFFGHVVSFVTGILIGKYFLNRGNTRLRSVKSLGWKPSNC